MTATETPLCVDTPELAKRLGVSAATVHSMDKLGTLPTPVRFGRCKRWSVDEIKAWLAAGAPKRAEWCVIRPASLN